MPMWRSGESVRLPAGGTRPRCVFQAWFLAWTIRPLPPVDLGNIRQWRPEANAVRITEPDDGRWSVR